MNEPYFNKENIELVRHLCHKYDFAARWLRHGRPTANWNAECVELFQCDEEGEPVEEFRIKDSHIDSHEAVLYVQLQCGTEVARTRLLGERNFCVEAALRIVESELMELYGN